MNTSALLRQMSKKLNEIDTKVSALLVREEPATKEELRAIRLSKKEIAHGKFIPLAELKTKYQRDEK